MFGGQRPSFHLIGLGGIGMSGLAEVLLARGFAVSGSDLRRSHLTERLATLGARVCEGHDAANLGAASVVVVTTAARPDNPEILEAKRRGVRVIRRAELLAELGRGKREIAIAGSHGKTTTTALVSHLLVEAGLDPTALVGGEVVDLGSNARVGEGDLQVVESDESDGSFLRLSPEVVVVTNVDPEHLDHWGSFQALRAAFRTFVEKVPFYGLAVLCADHAESAALAASVDRPVQTYGLDRPADWQSRDVQVEGATMTFEVLRHGTSLGRFSLGLVGRHHVGNALAALAVAAHVGVPPEASRAALARFRGIARRFQTIGVQRGVQVIDDYGHHPVEVAATIAGARAAWPGRRIVMAFQPHRFTRTRDLLQEFARCFTGVDALAILPIYAASEPPIPGVTHEALVARVRAAGGPPAEAVQKTALVGWLGAHAGDGALVLLQGAGDVNQAARPLLDALAGRGA